MTLVTLPFMSRTKAAERDARPRDRHRGDPDVLVDVREDNEWTAGHVGGTVRLGEGIIERDIESTVPQKDTELFYIAAVVFVRRW